MIKNLTLESFNEKIMNIETNVFKNEKPVVLKFGATRCSPCKAYAPIIEKVSEELTNVDFYEIDVDDEIEISNLFSIRSLPTTVVINTEGKKNVFSGTMQKSKLIDMINNS